MNFITCHGFNILPYSSFYPLYHPHSYELFVTEPRYNASQAVWINEIALGVHVWNKITADWSVKKNTPQLYVQLAKMHCPLTLALAPDVFWVQQSHAWLIWVFLRNSTGWKKLYFTSLLTIEKQRCVGLLMRSANAQPWSRAEMYVLVLIINQLGTKVSPQVRFLRLHWSTTVSSPELSLHRQQKLYLILFSPSARWMLRKI